MLLSLALLSTATPVAGQGTAVPKAPAATPATSRPSADFLEFLASFEDAAGRWQDPLLFDEPPMKKGRAPRQEAARDR
jgi:hypothetical protein